LSLGVSKPEAVYLEVDQFRVSGFGFRDPFRVWCLGLGVWGSGVWGVEFEFGGLGFKT
jgi:hypothetical protein